MTVNAKQLANRHQLELNNSSRCPFVSWLVGPASGILLPSTSSIRLDSLSGRHVEWSRDGKEGPGGREGEKTGEKRKGERKRETYSVS